MVLRAGDSSNPGDRRRNTGYHLATATNVGSTDTTDGPQTVTVANRGNAALTFPIPTSGNNPSISADFTLDSSGSGTCPLTTGTPNTLAAGASCALPISFAPTVAGAISGSLVLTDTNLNANPSTTQTISLTGTGQLQTPTLAFATIPNHILGDTPFIVTATSASSGAVTYSVTSGPATIAGNTLTITGTGTIVLSASQAAATSYAAATASTSFAVGAATPTLAFATIPNHTFGDAPFTVTATSASSGAVTYSVTSGPATVSGNTVTLTGAGTVVLSASQAASASYTAATASTSFTVAAAPVLDFSMSTPTTTQTQSVTRGGAATFTFSFAPTSGAYPGTVTFAATGLPVGATASFSPSTIAANGGAQTVTLTIQTSAVAGLSQPVSPLSHRGGLIAFALLFLPLAGTRRMRRVARKLSGRASLALLLLLSFGAVAGLSGCGGSSKPVVQPQSYTITVTATSGSVQHSSNVTLQLQ